LARELMDAYTPGLFELKFAEERTVSASKAGDRNTTTEDRGQFGLPSCSSG
jgi:hypothetical protein